ncbi:MAG: hypothetical protein R6X18_03355 [Chloroflexota bacterium]|jgi:hypothetical protein
MLKDRPFLISGILGLGVMAMTLFLAVLGPREFGELPPGFFTPIIAFEFAESPSEVYRMFIPLRAAEAMDRVNQWDFLYLILYGLFLVAFSIACVRHTGKRFYYFIAALALGIIVADALENVQLLGLTYRVGLDGGHLDDLLLRLKVFTWFKWGGLALYFLLLWPYFRGQAGRLARFLSVIALLPALTAVLAFLRRGVLNELLALSVGLMFILMTLYAWRQVLANQPTEQLSTDFHLSNG